MPLLPRRLVGRDGSPGSWLLGGLGDRLPVSPLPAGGGANLRPPSARSKKSRTTPRAAALLSAPRGEQGVGQLTAGMREKVNSKNENVFFPGGLILLLAIVGLFSSTYTPRLRIGVGPRRGWCARSLALGDGPQPRRLSLAAAVRLRPRLGRGAGARPRCSRSRPSSTRCSPAPGVQLLLLRFRRWWRDRPTGESGVLVAAPAAVGVVLLVGILTKAPDAWNHPVVPQPAGGRDPPARAPSWTSPPTACWTAYDRVLFHRRLPPKIPIGNSTFDIPAVDDLRGGMRGLPRQGQRREAPLLWDQDGGAPHRDPPRGSPPDKGNGDSRAARSGRRRPQADRPAWASRAGSRARS